MNKCKHHYPFTVLDGQVSQVYKCTTCLSIGNNYMDFYPCRVCGSTSQEMIYAVWHSYYIWNLPYTWLTGKWKPLTPDDYRLKSHYSSFGWC